MPIYPIISKNAERNSAHCHRWPGRDALGGRGGGGVEMPGGRYPRGEMPVGDALLHISNTVKTPSLFR